MSKKLFTEKIKILFKNKNIMKVSSKSKSIIYALEFKEKFVK